MNKLTLALLGTFVAILLLSGVLAYAFRERPTVVTTETSATPSASPSAGDKGSNEKKGQGSSEQKHNGGHSIISELFGLESPSIAPSTLSNWESSLPEWRCVFVWRRFLAALLAFVRDAV